MFLGQAGEMLEVYANATNFLVGALVVFFVRFWFSTSRLISWYKF